MVRFPVASSGLTAEVITVDALLCSYTGQGFSDHLAENYTHLSSIPLIGVELVTK